MQTHQDIWFNVSDQTEHIFFQIEKQPNPYLDFIPWPIRVTSIIFSDNSSMSTAGGGGAPALLAGPGISLTPGIGTLTITNTSLGQNQTPWLQTINGAQYDLLNVRRINVTESYSINGLPFAVAGSINLTNIKEISGEPAQPVTITSNTVVTGNVNITGTPAPAFQVNGVPLALGGTPAGAANQIQFNAGGTPAVFGASADFTWDDTTKVLRVQSAIEPEIVLADTAGGVPTFRMSSGASNVNFELDSTLVPPNFQIYFQGAAGNIWLSAAGAAGTAMLRIETGGVGINTGGTGTITYPLLVNGDVNIIGPTPVYRVNGTPLAFDATQINLNPQISTWTTVQVALGAVSTALTTLARGMAYVGFYNAATDVATFVPAMSTLDGPLPAADATGIHEGDFLIVTAATAGPPALNVGDQLISGGPTGGATWNILPIGSNMATVTAATVNLAPQIGTWVTVQNALTALAATGHPAGAVNQIQFNAGGTPNVFGASSNFTFDPAGDLRMQASGGVQVNALSSSLDLWSQVDANLTGTTGLTLSAITTVVQILGAEILLNSGAGTVKVGINQGTLSTGTSHPAYSLDVVGDCNIEGETAGEPMYRINGTPFAARVGTTTTFALTNIATINGAAPGATPPAGAVGQLQFNAGGTPLAFGASANLFWDNTNGRLGIHEAAPAYQLDVDGDINCTGSIYIDGVEFASPGSAHLHATTISGLDGEPLQITGDMQLEIQGRKVSLLELLARFEALEHMLGL